MRLEGIDITMAFEKKQVLDKVSFSLDTGQITALVGRNGAGKTTLLQILARILTPKEGKILLDQKEIEKNPSLQSNIAYLPDRFDFFKYDSPKKAMEYYQILYPNFDEKFFEGELQALDIPMKKSIRSLSKGNNTLLGLVMVLSTKAPFLLLDEVLDGMDVINSQQVMRYLIDAAGDGRSILVSSHQLQELQGIAHRVLYLSMDGSLKEMEGSKESPVLKYQVVTRSVLPEKIAKKSVERFHVGRVYTILVDGEEENWEQIFETEDIVQFDKLPVQLEDLFFWEKGRGKGVASDEIHGSDSLETK